MVLRKKRPAQRSAEKRRQTLAMWRPGIDGSHQHQSVQPRILALRRDGSHHDGDASAVGRSEQIEILNAESIRELQDALGCGSYGAVHAFGCGRETGAQIVDGIHGRVGRERRDGESPGKGIAHQPMNQNERWARPGPEVAHAPVREIEPVLLNQDLRLLGNSNCRRLWLGLLAPAGTNFSSGFCVSVGNEILADRFLLIDIASMLGGS